MRTFCTLDGLSRTAFVGLALIGFCACGDTAGVGDGRVIDTGSDDADVANGDIGLIDDAPADDSETPVDSRSDGDAPVEPDVRLDSSSRDTFDVASDMDVMCDESACAPSGPCEEVWCDGTECALRPSPAGTSCDDGLVCDGSGACVACSADAMCDDGASCTIDSCDTLSGRCEHTPASGICDDGLFCNGVEVCDPARGVSDGTGCHAGVPPELGDGLRCTIDRCDEQSDTITHTADASRCDDGNACTSDVCDPTEDCVNTPHSGWLCEADSGVCDADGGCADCVDDSDGVDTGCGGPRPFCMSGSCVACLRDGDCGTGLTCESNRCVGCTEASQCDDGVACTTDICESGSGVCTNVYRDDLCNDGAYCNGEEVCRPESPSASADGCLALGVPMVDDGVACTEDRCDEITRSVVHSPVDDACAVESECERGLCSIAGCTVVPVTDGELCSGGFCTAGSCASCVDDTAGGVDTGCSDAEPACIDGVCGDCIVEGPGCELDCAGVPGGSAELDACGVCDDNPANNCIACEGVECPRCTFGDDASCDDLNPCTTDRCTSDGVCEHDAAALDGAACDDADACTSGSTCSEGTCIADERTTCDGPCESGPCDPATGCGRAEVGELCTGVEGLGACAADGSCQPGCEQPEDVCDYRVLSFVDDGELVCLQYSADRASCEDDGDPCTQDFCFDGECLHTFDVDTCGDCADLDCSGPCLTGVCVEGFGCLRKATGQACDDGDPDTVSDMCNGLTGQCAGRCPDLECGTYLPIFGETCGTVVTGTQADRQCDFSDDPCLVEYCGPDGTCQSVPAPAGRECAHPCGGGVCGADGECELVDDTCSTQGTACFDTVCDEEQRRCVRSGFDDVTCSNPATLCVPQTGLCTGGYCGDGACDVSDTNLSCGADCPDNCMGNRSNCYLRYTDIRWVGAWRANQSLAYGFPSTTAQQTETFTRMLDDGIRWLHLTVDYCTPGSTEGPLCLCGADNDCLLDSLPADEAFDEIEAWMSSHSGEVVTLYLDEYVEDVDFLTALAESGLDQRLYSRTSSASAYELWPLTLGEMVNEQRTLVVFGAGILSRSNVLLADYFEPRAGSGNPGSVLFGDPSGRAWECFDSARRSPMSIPGFRGLYVLNHAPSSVLTSWPGASCHNEFTFNHSVACEEFGTPNAMFFQYYNSAAAPLNWASYEGTASYASRCAADVEGCVSDEDCEVGVCGGLFVCLNCADNSDCRPDQFCDTNFGACLPDLEDGAVCLSDEVCRSGNCDLLCTSCTVDADCDDGRWCDAFGGCQRRKANGFGCITGVECLSGNCFAGFCVDCDEQSDCDEEPGTFCSLDPLPGESRCIDQKPNGALCNQPFECASDACYAATCAECDEHADCATTQYCTLAVVPGVVSTCETRRGFGGACLSGVECLSGECSLGACTQTCGTHGDCDAGRWCDVLGFCQTPLENGRPCVTSVECESGACAGGVCADCNSNDDCTNNEFCGVSTDPATGFSTCLPKKSIGEVCVSPTECISGDCFLGFCVECDAQQDCTGGQFCSLDPSPGESACIDRKPNGGLCAQNLECVSGNCWATVCSECNEQSDCGPGTYCNLDVVPPIVSECEALKSNGSFCGTSVECVSGQCTLGVCGQCVDDGQCAANQHCDAFNNCANDVGNNAPCLRDSACTTGICSAGFCAQCTTDGHCPASQHCDPFGDCINDVGNDVACTRSQVCTTGLCLDGFCAICNGDTGAFGCPASQHCDAFNNCANDVGNNAPCLRNSACTTGICSAGFCAECTSDANCPASEHCDAGGDCIPDVGNNAPCVRDSVCSTGICSAGFCAQCTTDAHCPSSQHCDAFGDCVADVGNNAPCTRDSVCSTGICSAGFCAQCLSYVHCPANHYCNIGGDCIHRSANGSACVTGEECLSGCCSFLTCGGFGC